MSDESKGIDKLLIKRTELVGELSLATAEHLRMLQMSSGIDVLLMKQPQSAEGLDSKFETDTRISNSQSRIEALEISLAAVDSDIAESLNSEV